MISVEPRAKAGSSARRHARHAEAMQHVNASIERRRLAARLRFLSSAKKVFIRICR
jgi:hypothetical protein